MNHPNIDKKKPANVMIVLLCSSKTLGYSMSVA